MVPAQKLLSLLFVMSDGHNIETLHTPPETICPHLCKQEKERKLSILHAIMLLKIKELSLAPILWADMQLNKSEFISKTILQLQIMTEPKYSVIIFC